MIYKNEKNQYRCHFCQRMCRQTEHAGGYGKNAHWYSCKFCRNVFFAAGPKNRLEAIHYHIDKNKESYYTLEIDYRKNETRLDYWSLPDIEAASPSITGGNITICGGTLQLSSGTYYIGGTGQTFSFTVKGSTTIWDKIPQRVITFSKCLDNLTPKNVNEKLKMYILFS